jgi:2-keto-4-pentenoate hydratase/2-oxohepta-3-ene-1,7-dioic acid hydratase in catechol pathway
MNLVTYSAGGRQYWGVTAPGGVASLSELFPQWTTLRDVIKAGAIDQILAVGAGRAASHPEGSFSYDIPIPDPEKIICVGVNFPDRNAEYKDGQDAPPNMSLFPRFARSFTGHGRPLIRPRESAQLDYESEIAVIIGKGGRRIPEAEALRHIVALTLCNEGTIRDWVRHAKFNVTQGNNWDRSGSIGPWAVPFSDPAQIVDLALETRVNGELRQNDRTARLLFPVARQIAYISTFTTLVPGDIIVTGTPTGAGGRFEPPIWLKLGDVVEVTVEGIGTLRNGVADECPLTRSDPLPRTLYLSERSGRQCGLLSQIHPGMTLDDGYAVQAALVERKCAAGAKVIGWKIGLTCRAMQQGVNITTPDSGVLLDDMLFADEATVPKGRFIQPRVEAEIAFVMQALLLGQVTRDQVLAATDYVAPALGILDTRVLRADPATGRARIITDTVSNNAANAGIVLGRQRHAGNAFDLRWVGAIVSRDDVVKETDLGAASWTTP